MRVSCQVRVSLVDLMPAIPLTLGCPNLLWTYELVAADATIDYMSSEPIRIDADTLQALRACSAQSGEPIVRLAQRYIEEGMRRDRHPGILFRDGPTGRRAVLVGGPDVWEVIVAVRGGRQRGARLVRAVAEGTGITEDKVRIAIRYYAECPDEVDNLIDRNEREAEDLRRTLEREQRLLG